LNRIAPIGRDRLPVQQGRRAQVRAGARFFAHR
jgi:hypothetical protein